jgi:hypothetical protein
MDPITEEEYALAEREGMKLDSILCPDCPALGDCQAEGVCIGRAEHAQDSSPSIPEWDVIA